MLHGRRYHWIGRPRRPNQNPQLRHLERDDVLNRRSRAGSFVFDERPDGQSRNGSRAGLQ
jgi:hypothetical protein